MDDSDLFGGSDDFGGPDGSYEESRDGAGGFGGGAGPHAGSGAPSGLGPASPAEASSSGIVGEKLHNQPFDEAFDVSDGGDDDDVPNPDAVPAQPERSEPIPAEDSMDDLGVPPGGHPPHDVFPGDHDETLDRDYDGHGDDDEQVHSGDSDSEGFQGVPGREPVEGDYAVRGGSHKPQYSDSNGPNENMHDRLGAQVDHEDQDYHHQGYDDNSGSNNNQHESSTRFGGGRDGADLEDSEAFDTHGEYDPGAYDHLDVDSEVRELFTKIGRYEPHTVELDTPLQPFIPDYIPSVGDLDAFIKPDRPDMRRDGLGTDVLDEPATRQSNPAALQLELRSKSKVFVDDSAASTSTSAAAQTVGSTEYQNDRAIDDWIASAEKVHRTGAPTHFEYRAPMPSVDALMQVWPSDMERLIEEVGFPGAELDVTLQEYAALGCAILDVPFRKGGELDALHMVFSLYAEFMESQHFGGGVGPMQ